jgi:hypothetical protein
MPRKDVREALVVVDVVARRRRDPELRDPHFASFDPFHQFLLEDLRAPAIGRELVYFFTHVVSKPIMVSDPLPVRVGGRREAVDVDRLPIVLLGVLSDK